jgi:hypothetical protein
LRDETPNLLDVPFRQAADFNAEFCGHA